MKCKNFEQRQIEAKKRKSANNLASMIGLQNRALAQNGGYIGAPSDVRRQAPQMYGADVASASDKILADGVAIKKDIQNYLRSLPLDKDEKAASPTQPWWKFW